MTPLFQSRKGFVFAYELHAQRRRRKVDSKSKRSRRGENSRWDFLQKIGSLAAGLAS